MNRVVKYAMSAVSLGVGLELGTRADERIRWGMPILSTAAAVTDIIAIDSSGARGIPGAQYRQFAMNSIGLRGPEPTPGRPRILVLGASETFGLYEKSGQEYPRQLQDSLRASGCDIDVLNAGLPGFSLPTLTVSFRNRLRSLGASLVVLYPTPTQYLDDERPAFHPPAAPVTPHPPQGLRSLRRLRDHMKVVLPARLQTYLRLREIARDAARAGHAGQWTEIPADRLRAFHDDVVALVDTVRASGVPLLLLTHANAFPSRLPIDRDRLIAWAKFYPRASMNVLPAFERAANDILLQTGRDAGVRTDDLAADMSAFNPAEAFADFSHFTEFGSAKVAGRLTQVILGSAGCPVRALASAALRRTAPR